MSAAPGSSNKLDEVRQRLLQEARLVADAEAEQVAADTAPPPRNWVWRYRRPIFTAVAALVIAGSAFAVYSYYRYYNPAARHSGEEIRFAREGVDSTIIEELERRGIEPPARPAETESLEELGRRALMKRNENLDDIPARSGGRLGEP